MATATVAGAGGISLSRPVFSPWLIAISVMLATFMEVLDTSIASVALPHIAGSLSATNDEATWVLTSYLVANAIVLPASSWFSLKFGRKRFLITCIIIFTVSSFACGAATSLGMILFARAIQGAGGGALQPLSQSIVLESFPPEKRGLALAVFALGVVVAPVLGPTLGGYLTDTYSWRWAFYINIPIGLFAVFMIMRYIQDPPYIRNAKPGRIDGIGLGLLAVWLGCLQVVLDKGQEDDWFGATWIRWTVLVLVITFVAFIWHELTARQTPGGPARLSTPKLPAGLHSDRAFWRRHLRAHHAAAAVLSGAAGLHGFGRGLGGKPARRRRDHRYAYHRDSHRQA